MASRNSKSSSGRLDKLTPLEVSAAARALVLQLLVLKRLLAVLVADLRHFPLDITSNLSQNTE